jgi:Flp pilus assembly protein TadG
MLLPDRHFCRQRSGFIKANRGGVAVVELAILLPFLFFIFVAAVDYARVFYYYLTVTNCACQGALYASTDHTHALDTSGIQTAALADAADLKPTPSVSSTTGTDSAGNPLVKVTVTYPFKTVTSFPGIPSSVTIRRTVQMRVAPTAVSGGDD